MQITLNSVEIKAAIAAYIKNQGLSFDTVPEVTLTAYKREFFAGVEFNPSVTLGIGPAEVEILPGKGATKEELKAFKVEPEPVKKTRKKRSDAGTKKVVAPDVQEAADEIAEESVVEETPFEEEPEPVVDEASTGLSDSSLFVNSDNGDGDFLGETDSLGDEVSSDVLFGDV